MNKVYKINKTFLKLIKKNNNNCLCKFNKSCPCEDFLENDKCTCKLYEPINV